MKSGENLKKIEEDDHDNSYEEDFDDQKKEN
jgi:hypothetical protein